MKLILICFIFYTKDLKQTFPLSKIVQIMVRKSCNITDNIPYFLVIYELAIDIIHSLSLNQECRQKMLLSAIKHSMNEVIVLFIYILSLAVSLF